MLITVYTRHVPTCSHKSDRTYRRCTCPKYFNWQENGVQRRISAGTRDWEAAQKMAQQKERGNDLQTSASGSTEPMAALRDGVVSPRRITVQEAVELYLDDKRSQQLEESTIRKLELIFQKHLLSWCNANAIRLLVDLNLTNLRKWRSTWEDGPLAAKKKQERVRGFFYFCQSSGWIADNPAKGLSRIKVDPSPTDYFTREEFDKIIDATYVYDSKTVNKFEMQNNATRLRTLTWLMRYSGLAIRDAVTLERPRLDSNNNLFLYRAKTGTPVYVPLPSFVAEALRSIPPGPKPNPRYFFWSGNGDPKSVVADWQRAYRKLFRIADIRHPDGKPKRCFPHMLRDTFAVENLLAGVPLDQVALLLGHSSIKTTEKHYAPFVRARQDQLLSAVKAAWGKMGIGQKSKRQGIRPVGTTRVRVAAVSTTVQ